MCQKAKILYDKREIDLCEESLQVYNLSLKSFKKKIFESDPYNIESMDCYSNVLFVKQNKKKLAELYHRFSSIQKYRPETYLITANYLSVSKKHEKAIEAFKRAILLKPDYVEAFILLGHEHVELKQLESAQIAYRKALEIDKTDYRAWYGLGQINEIHNRDEQALYFFQKAVQYKPNSDSIWCALGLCYEKEGHYEKAIRSFHRAEECVDEDKIATAKLAELYSKIGEFDNAIFYCKKIVEGYTSKSWKMRENIGPHVLKAMILVAEYEIKAENLDDAEELLNCVSSFEGTIKENSESLLAKIKEMRGQSSSAKKELKFD